MLMTVSSARAAPRDTVDLPEPYKIPTNNPGDMDAIHDVTGAIGFLEGEIAQDLQERAVCGGWNMNISAVSRIPTVVGVPGRVGDPFAKKPSGMAFRDESSGALGDGYVYPVTTRARGWSTACRPGFPPFFDDGPPCKKPDDDPNKDNMATPDRCQTICHRMNKWQSPVWVDVWWKIISVLPPVIDVQTCVQHGNLEKARNDDPLNGDCCERLGAFDAADTDPRDKAPSCKNKYPGGTAEDANPMWDPYPGKMPPNSDCDNEVAGFTSGGYARIHFFSGWYYCCSGARVSKLEYETCTLGAPGVCAAHPDARRNCVRCAGDGLATGILPGSDVPCLLDADCPTPLQCKNSKLEQEFPALSCINERNCEINSGRGNCFNGLDDDLDGLTDSADPQCINGCSFEGSGPPAGIDCRPFECRAGTCIHPAVFGQCLVSDGSIPTIDYNGELIPRPIRRETGCRAGYGATKSGNKMIPGLYVSYFREYPRTGYARQSVPNVPSDVRTRINIPVTCFGFYNEFDTKIRKAEQKDQRCVIGAYKAPYEFRTFYKTQRGKGRFFQSLTPLDPNPTSSNEIRNRFFNANQDLWYGNLGGAFSLINGEVFKRKYGQDLTFALLSLDSTLQRARGAKLKTRSASSAATSGSSSSTYGPDPYMNFRSLGGLRRAFDDSVTNDNGNTRIHVETWQKYETEMQQLMHPPVVHIIFPSAWSANLELQETLFNTNPPKPPKPPAKQWSHEPERKTMEVQLEARDDVLGDVAALLESAIIAPVRERPLPLIVPFGSATDFRAYKEGWIRWKKLRIHEGTTPGSEVDDLINRLEEYAVTIDKARSLRAELPSALGKALVQQNILRKVINDWLTKHLATFRAFEEQRKTIRDQIVPAWKEAQKAYRDFHDITNMPWCKNDTFTTPIYSFLGAGTGGRSEIPSITRPEDLFIDLTGFEISTDTILIPVIKPIQILINHDNLRPPGALERTAAIPTLPPLPPLPVLSISGALALPVKTEKGLTVEYPALGNGLAAVTQFIDAQKSFISTLKEAYGKFWDAIVKPRCGTPEAFVRCKNDDPGQIKGDCCVLPGEEVYCRKGWGKDTCVHVEMDLLERFTRIGARPAVELQEDFEVTGAWRAEGRGDFHPCDPEDWACQDLHKQKVLPRMGWFSDVKVRDQTSSIDQWRVELFRDTLQNVGASSAPSIPSFPYRADRNTITPSFDQRPSLRIHSGSLTP